MGRDEIDLRANLRCDNGANQANHDTSKRMGTRSYTP
jgi:hypothetical protein